MKIARFICPNCNETVSILPSFVLPYRNRLISEVDTYFMADACLRTQQSGSMELEKYWDRWVCHWKVLYEGTAWPPGSLKDRSPKGYWAKLRAVAGGIEAASRQLICDYQISLLGTYRCHRPRRAIC